MKTETDEKREAVPKPLWRWRKVLFGLLLGAVALGFYVSIMLKIAYYGP